MKPSYRHARACTCGPSSVVASRTDGSARRHAALARAPRAEPDLKDQNTAAAQEGASKPAAPKDDPLDPLNFKRKTREADSTDWISTQLTKRFGLAGGLAWVVFLAVGSLGEQVKTRLEVAREESSVVTLDAAPLVTLPSGVTYKDLRIGGGGKPQKGYLIVLNYRASANGVPFEDTYARGKPIVFFSGAKPYTGGMNAGLEEVISGMQAGGRRVCSIPAALGFGNKNFSLRPTLHAEDKSGVVPANSDLEYDVELVRVSVPPS